MRVGGGWKSQKNFKAPNYSERLKVMTLTFWKFKGIHLCTYVFLYPQKASAIKKFIIQKAHFLRCAP